MLEVISELRLTVARLEQELLCYRNRKNSNNSHLPPSKDENRPARNQSLREKSGKKSGGQLGHEGKTLEFSSQVDKVVSIVQLIVIAVGMTYQISQDCLLRNVRF